MILEILLGSLLGILSLAVAYLYLLAAVGIFFRQTYREVRTPHRFLVLVPAHDEEGGITRTIQSLQQMECVDRAKIVVIADNCTDNTAFMARTAGGTVLERTDPDNRGKGYALEWALAQFDLDEYDAVAIVDADTLVEPNMLAAMTQSFEAGAGAVQCNYTFSAETDSPIAYLVQMANAAENILFYKPRGFLHLPVLLRGNGMAIKSSVLKAHPMDSHSITEDVDYAVDLLKNGIRIDYSVERTVRSPATASYEQSYDQKLRWAAGTFSLITSKGLPLVALGLTRWRWDLLELAGSFLLLSRPTLVYVTLIILAGSIWINPPYSLLFAGWCTGVILHLVLYLILGVFFVENKAATIRALLHTPFYAVWLAAVQIKALLKRGKLGWVRTKRDSHD